MSDDDLPPLDDDIRALVDRARGIRSAPPGTRARVFDKVETAIGTSGGGGGGPGDVGPGGGSVSLPPARASGWARPFASGALVFSLGGLTGAIVTHSVERPPVPAVRELPTRIVYVERPALAAPSAEATSDGRPIETERSLDASGRTSNGAVRAMPPAGTVVRAGVSEERILLDRARGALESEEWGSALAATREHERRFPNGLLVQEREFMAAKALAMMGRMDEARARARRLRARFPDSMLLPALDSVVDAGPPALP